MSAIREKILEVAVAEATPQPYGKVSDLVRDSEGKRAGWKRLKQYFDEAVLGWTERNWQGRGKIKPLGGNWVDITYLEGVQVPTYRVPQLSKETGVSWCGIFATWVLQQAGLSDAKWVVGVGIQGAKVKLVYSNEGYERGDVLVFKGIEVHHAIFLDEDHRFYDGDGSLRTVNGNSDHQSIIMHSRYSPKNVGYYYKILD